MHDITIKIVDMHVEITRSLILLKMHCHFICENSISQVPCFALQVPVTVIICEV